MVRKKHRTITHLEEEGDREVFTGSSNSEISQHTLVT